MNASGTRLLVEESTSGKRLVNAGPGDFREIEGNWYVDPIAVNAAHLELTSHEYVCPYKGRCHYVDFVDGDRRVARVAWVYDDVKDGWEHIKGKYGFYAGETAAKLGKTKDTVS